MGAVLRGRRVVDTCFVVLAFNEKDQEWREICKHYIPDNPDAARAEAELNARRITDINGVPSMVAEWVTTSSIVKTFRPDSGVKYQ